MASHKICVLGCGVMGTALVKGWKDKHETSLYTKRASSEKALKALSSRVYSGNNVRESIEGCDIVILGFMPGDAAEVLELLEAKLKGKLIISLLAGVSTPTLKGLLPQNQVVRLIPTIAAEYGQSATMIADGPDLEVTEQLFSSIGSTLRVPEKLMDEATAIGAAVHALAIVAVDSATDASVCSGVPRSLAASIVVQALQSAVGLLNEMEPAVVKTAMSTPGGITINAVSKLDASVRGGVAEAVNGAVEHTRRMG